MEKERGSRGTGFRVPGTDGIGNEGGGEGGFIPLREKTVLTCPSLIRLADSSSRGQEKPPRSVEEAGA